MTILEVLVAGRGNRGNGNGDSTLVLRKTHQPCQLVSKRR